MRPERVCIIFNAIRKQLFHLIDESGGKMLLRAVIDFFVKNVSLRIQHKKPNSACKLRFGSSVRLLVRESSSGLKIHLDAACNTDIITRRQFSCRVRIYTGEHLMQMFSATLFMYSSNTFA